MVGFLCLGIFWICTLKQTMKNHALYEENDPRGIPFWYSPPALVTVPVLVFVLPVSHGVPWFVPLPLVLLYGAFALHSIASAWRARK